MKFFNKKSYLHQKKIFQKKIIYKKFHRGQRDSLHEAGCTNLTLKVFVILAFFS